MSISFKDLKNEKYLEPTRRFVEDLLNIQFLKDSNSAHCPFQETDFKNRKETQFFVTVQPLSLPWRELLSI